MMEELWWWRRRQKEEGLTVPEESKKDCDLCNSGDQRLPVVAVTSRSARRPMVAVTFRFGSQPCHKGSWADAFGESGRPASGDEGVVPPNASLQIELELVSWKTVSDITKDMKVLKKTLKEGEGYERPNDGAVDQEIPVKLIGKLQDGTVFLKKGHDDEQPFEFKIDEEQVIDGLDRAVKNMKKWEIALVIIQPEYAFGPSESPQELGTVPPNSTVYYEVELLSFVKESWDLNTQEKIEAAGKKKEEGNALFKAGKYERASKRYEKAIKFIEYDSSFSDEEKQQTKVLKITCNLNNAACKLKLRNYKEAEKLCTKVLELDSRNVKALYRRAQAYIQLVDLDEMKVSLVCNLVKLLVSYFLLSTYFLLIPNFKLGGCYFIGD